jgi:hypothetical protein
MARCILRASLSQERMRECVIRMVIGVAPYTLWHNFLDTQGGVSYTADN